MKLLGSVALVAFLGACASNEPEPMAPAEQPIYSKDGQIIGMRPVVMASDDCDPNAITTSASNPDGIDAEAECFDDRTQGTLSQSGGALTVDTDGDGIPDSDDSDG